MLAYSLNTPVIWVAGPVCAWLALGMPFAWMCRRIARDDALTQLEALICGLFCGPFGILIVRRANALAARRAEIAAGELEIKLIQAREEAAAERAAIEAQEGAPVEAFKLPPKLADNAPLPPEALPGAPAFRPPPPEVQGAWLIDPPSTPPQPAQPATSDSDPPQPVTSNAS